MKSEPKAFASLSSGLLARKGAARPAMKPQGFGQMGGGLDDLGWNDMGFEPPKPSLTPVRDFEHDGFGEAVPEPALRNPVAGLTPISPVHHQQAEIAERLAGADETSDEGEAFDETAEPITFEPSTPVTRSAELAEVVQLPQSAREPDPAPRRAPRPRSAAGIKAKAAFTLRLDPERHLRLRLACAVMGKSAQQTVTKALDAFLAAMPELDAMAKKAPDRTNQKG